MNDDVDRKLDVQVAEALGWQWVYNTSSQFDGTTHEQCRLVQPRHLIDWLSYSEWRARVYGSGKPWRLGRHGEELIDVSDSRVWHFTSRAGADNKVLEWVLLNWKREQPRLFIAYSEQLDATFKARYTHFDTIGVGPIYIDAMRYKPGDYSRALLAVLAAEETTV